MKNQTEQQTPVSFALNLQAGKAGGQEIRMREMLHVLVKRRTWIVICVIFGLIFGLSLSVASYIKSQAIKQYTIKTSIALTSQSENGLFSRQSRDPDDIDFHLAEDMVDAAIYILMSDSMLNKIIEDVNLLGVTSREIYNSMILEQYRQTQIILITLYWGNAAEGVRILEAVNRLAPDMLVDTMKLGSVTVINQPTARFVIGANLNLIRNLIIGFVLGAITGSALAILDLLLHPTMQTLTDVERNLNIPLLGVISENRTDIATEQELLSKPDGARTRSELADSFLALAYTLRYRLAELDHPCVLITSAEREEGKTYVTACLAAALSQIGVRVLAVDFDFLNPMLGGQFLDEVDPARTVNALYQGKTLSRDAVVPVNGMMDILPALLEREPMPLNAAAMDLVWSLKSEYDIVLLDTPPVGQIADTMALSGLTQQALFVIQYDMATQAALKEALGRLDRVGIGAVGAVVNRMNRKRKDYRDRQNAGKKKNLLAKLTKRFRKKEKSAK